MTTPLLTWISVVAFLIIVLSIRFSVSFFRFIKRHNIFSIGDEREEFYIPGDEMHADRKEIR